MSPSKMAECLKWLALNANRPLTEDEKLEAHKAIDECKSIKELAKVALKIANIK